jgi:hypothetical protein
MSLKSLSGRGEACNATEARATALPIATHGSRALRHRASPGGGTEVAELCVAAGATLVIHANATGAIVVAGAEVPVATMPAVVPQPFCIIAICLNISWVLLAAGWIEKVMPCPQWFFCPQKNPGMIRMCFDFAGRALTCGVATLSCIAICGGGLMVLLGSAIEPVSIPPAIASQGLVNVH